jgi:hypothetical protein
VFIPNGTEATASNCHAHRFWPLNQKLVRLSRQRQFFYTSDACENVFVWGSIGSAKTSTTFSIWGQSYLEAGFGAICLGPKADFADTIRDIAWRAGREDDVIYVRPGWGNGLDVLKYESQIFGPGQGIVENIVDVLFAASEVINRNYGSSTDPFWEKSCRQMLKNLAFVDLQAHGSVNVERLLLMVQTIPQGYDQLSEPEKLASLQALAEALDNCPPEKMRQMAMAHNYLTKAMPNLSPNTRSSIQITVEVMLDAFCRDEVYEGRQVDTRKHH